MPTKKNENPVEAEVVEDEVKIDKPTYYSHKHRGGFFVGSILLILGVFLILENYLQVDLMQYFWPVLLLLLGGSLIYRSFNR